jgi:hypothetical protein
VSLKAFLQEKRQAIKQRWLDLVLADYSPDTSKFLKNKKDQFANPVGHTLTQGLDVLADAIIDERDAAEVDDTLDDVIRIRAVQELPPSVGVGFLQALKRAVELEAGTTLDPKDLRDFDQRVDAMSLRAFDVYMACRAKIFELRINDLRRNTLGAREQVALRKARQQRGSDDNHENE